MLPEWNSWEWEKSESVWTKEGSKYGVYTHEIVKEKKC